MRINQIRNLPALLALFGTASLAACSLTPNEAPSAAEVEQFTYSNFRQVPLSLTVTDAAGVGLMGVQVTIRKVSALPFDHPEYVPGQVLFRGRSGADGVLSLPVSFPADTGEVEVISHLKGFQGTFSEPNMLRDWGAFAPSSLVKISLSELSNFRLSLTETN